MNELVFFAVRSNLPFGGWGCGYVALPLGHHLHGMDFEDIHYKYLINVNGGLTFSKSAREMLQFWKERGVTGIERINADDWVIGFDTAHAYDDLKTWPSEYSILQEAERLARQCILTPLRQVM